MKNYYLFSHTGGIKWHSFLHFMLLCNKKLLIFSTKVVECFLSFKNKLPKLLNFIYLNQMKSSIQIE